MYIFTTLALAIGASTALVAAAPTANNQTRTKICVQYDGTSTAAADDLVAWLRQWASTQPANSYLPEQLVKQFNIPKQAFDCPGPDSKGVSNFMCSVTTDNYCFEGIGTQDDLTSAWKALNMIARWRVSLTVVQVLFLNQVYPPSDQNTYGTGVAGDFTELFQDFYNGAMGDSPIPGENFNSIIGSLLLFAPFNLAQQPTIWKTVADAMTTADKQAFQGCSWYDLANKSDCVTTNGFNVITSTLFTQTASLDKEADWPELIGEMATFPMAINPNMDLVLSGYAKFRDFYQRAMWMQIQRQQNVFMHVQPYDLDSDTGEPYWGTDCASIILDSPGGACQPTSASPDDGNSMAYYPVQITGHNNTLDRDYPAFEQVAKYGWNPHEILGMSRRCSDLQSQSFDLSPAYPQIFETMRDQDKALAWIGAANMDSPGQTDCLWSLPAVYFSEGPHYKGLDKLRDTIGILDGDNPRQKWKDAGSRDEQLWAIIRGQPIYCENQLPDIGGYWHQLGQSLGFQLGLGADMYDDMVLSDLYAAQQLVTPGSPAATALEQVHGLACDKQIQDTADNAIKDMVDLLINLAAFAVADFATDGVAAVLMGSLIASEAQTFIDTLFLQPWLDSVLKQQFTMSDAAEAVLQDHFSTKKLGD